MTVTVLSEHGCFGGVVRFCEHDSSAIGLPMRFSVFLPASALAAGARPHPTLIYLAGLTCNEETFMTKAGAQRVAAELGLVLVAPDTSPRGAGVAGESQAWDFGVGAGFYLDATQSPWREHYRMESYIADELPSLLAREFAVDLGQLGLFGHSMGGHGALTLALRHAGKFKTVSAFAPICAPTQCPWGENAFSGYLGDDREAWRAHDASELMKTRSSAPYPAGILIDQGMADKFLGDQLHPHLFEAACAQAGQPLMLRRHAGYDHGYYFISTFMEEHLRFHSKGLGA